jgi:hypothetical protein
MWVHNSLDAASVDVTTPWTRAPEPGVPYGKYYEGGMFEAPHDDEE